MYGAVLYSALLAGGLTPGQGAQEAPIAIELKAQSGKASRTAHVQPVTFRPQPGTRGLLQVKAGAPITIRWTVTHAKGTAPLKNLLLHGFVVKEEKANQAVVPKLNKGVVFETGQTLDLDPKSRTEGELEITISQPGYYLLRLETIGVESQSYFAALDLHVQ
jgi:hypothetical protein